jgi:hypothetical protein
MVMQVAAPLEQISGKSDKDEYRFQQVVLFLT